MIDKNWFIERISSYEGRKVMDKMGSRVLREFKDCIENWHRYNDDDYLEQAMGIWEQYDDDIPPCYKYGSKRRW